MWVFDRHSLRFLAVNHATIGQYGFTEQEFLAMTLADIRPREDVPILKKHLETFDPGSQQPGNWRHCRKNGTIIDVEVEAHSLEFHGVEAVLAAIYDITERKRAEEALLFKTALLEAQSETTLDGILVVDESDRIILANRRLALHFAIPDELLNSRDDHAVRKYAADQMKDPEAFTEKVTSLYGNRDEKSRDEIQLRNGKVFDRYSAPLIDSVSRYRGRIWYFRDVTEQRRAEAAAREAEEKYRAIFDNSVIGIFRATLDGRPIKVNRALAQMHGYASGEELEAKVSNVAAELFVNPGRMAELVGAVADGGTVRDAEVEIYSKDGARRWILVNLQGVQDGAGKVIFVDGTTEDITFRKVAEEKIRYLAYFDALTDLPNRTLLTDRLTKALAGARRRNERVAILFLDLDRFKLINDSLGHSVGDLLLKDVAERLKACTRDQDTVARMSGDEFVIVLSGVKDSSEAEIAAQRIVGAIAGTFVVKGHSLSTSCSLGISLFPDHSEDSETLIKYADEAMYCAKESGRNDLRLFDEDMNRQAVKRLTLENDLRLALQREEFFLVYQPQVDITCMEITGLEALIRWQHPTLGLVPPNDFIGIAESSGLILPLGEWVLRTACAQARTWLDDGLLTAPVAVNVSAVQFRQETFCQVLREILFETGLPPQYLELELTETLLLSNEDVMFAVLRELAAIGVSLVIDDFGTGYSSLSYLKQFRVSKLKIDRSFIQDVAENADDAAITSAIINMARSLNLKVVAEGVETEAQLTFLREHQCDEIQGYYFSRPVTPKDLAARLLSPVPAIGR